MCNFFCLLISVLTLAVGKILLNNNINKIETEETYAESDFYFQVVTKSYKAGSSKTTKSEGSESGQTSQSDDVPGCFDVGWYEDENDNKKNFDATLGYSGGSHDGGRSTVSGISAFYYHYYNWWSNVRRHGRIEINTYKSSASDTGWQFCGVDSTGSDSTRSTVYTWYKHGSAAPTSSKSGWTAEKTMSGICYVVYRWNYSLQFNANGGSGAPSSKTFLSGTSTTIPSTKPTRTGYTFDDWYTSSSGGSKV